MIERICPKCKVPMKGEKCIKENCGCNTEISAVFKDKTNILSFQGIRRSESASRSNQVGKQDAEEYVDSRNWKARQGGNGLAAAQKSIERKIALTY